MPGVSKIGDTFNDTDIIATGSGDVFVNNIPAARLSDMTTGHTLPGHTFYPPVPITTGSGSVFVNNLPLARIGDAHAEHCDDSSGGHTPDCHTAVIDSGSTDVFSDGL